MYEQNIREDILYLMFYAGVTVLNLIACFYLFFRRGNAIAPGITPPVRLRRWTAAFLGAAALSHTWYTPILYLTSAEDIKMVYFVGGVLDFLTVFPLAIAVLFCMLQDRSRPLWPIGVMVAPLVVGLAICVITCSDAILPVLYVYFLLLTFGLIIYMVRETRKYGRWLHDNYADLEHKEVWQSLLVLAIILIGFSLYAFTLQNVFYMYASQVNVIILTCFLVWRTETLSDLSQWDCESHSTDAGEETVTMENDLSQPIQGKIGQLLERHCKEPQLYLWHDLTAQQLAKAVGTNRYYLSQYFAQQGITYNAYINELRIDHFISLYRKAVAARHPFTVKQLAEDSGYRNYATFSNAFKQRMGKNVTAWMLDNDA